MNRRNPGFFALLILVFLLGSGLGASAKSVESKAKIAADKAASKNSFFYFDTEVKSRLKGLESIIKPRYNDEVKRYVENYVVWHRKFTEDLIGRASMYFPIFDQVIKRKNLPKELKHIAIIESSLNPTAKSYAGAAGIWQIIPGTATLCGLRMNKHVDERRDIVRSTEAAISYLEKLYKIYGDWALAIAAYNCGPGNVDRAIGKAKSNDYWKVEAYLPNETRNYVPRFIAANYIMNYYTEYDITPTILNMDLQLTESVRIFKGVSFKEIIRITGIPDSVLEALNPGFKTKFIPASVEGYNVLMPKRVIPIIDLFNASPDQNTIDAYFGNNDFTNPNGYNWSDQYVVTQYQVQKDDNLQSVSEVFACDPYHLIVWNNLTDDKINPGQTLLVYIPKKIYMEKFFNTSFSPLPISIIDEVNLEENEAPVEVANISADYNAYAPSDRKYLYHYIRQRESLQEIASQYSSTTISDLLLLNEIDDPSAIRPGMILKIREL